MKWELAIFDWNGTILNDFKMLHRCIVAIAKHYNFNTPTIEQCRNELSHNWIEVYYKWGLSRKVKPDELRKFRRHYVKDNWRGAGLFSDVKKTIAACLEMNLKLAIVSAEQADFLLNRLNRYNLLSSFIDIRPQSYDKKTMFLEVLKKLSVAPEKTFYVDDTADGILEAKEVGLTTFGITRGYNTPERIRAAKPTYVVDTLDEVIRILEVEEKIA